MNRVFQPLGLLVFASKNCIFGHVGVISGHLGACFGLIWCHFGPSCTLQAKILILPRCLYDFQVAFGSFRGHVGAILAHPGALLGHFGVIFDNLGASWVSTPMGKIVANRCRNAKGPHWGCLGSSLGPLGWQDGPR